MRAGILGFVRLDTSFGEASSRTQATDPNRRETLRIRTPLPGLRGEAKWLAVEVPVKRRRSQYAVECQSSYERGAARDFFPPGVCFLMCHAEDAPRAEARRVRATWRPRASRQKGGMRWTLIVRAEVGPHRRCLILLRAHAYSARPLIPARPAAGWLSVCPLTLVTFRDVRGVFAMATITRTAALDEAH